MNPIAIPVAILYVSGIQTIVKKAGTAISKRVHSILPNDETIRAPTIIRAGAVTAGVITSNKGKKKSDNQRLVLPFLRQKYPFFPPQTPLLKENPLFPSPKPQHSCR